MKQLTKISNSLQAFFRQLTATPPQEQPSQPPQRTLGLALGGGFARGLVHIGVLKVLEEEKIPVAAIAGTSAGAIVGACYCSGLSAADMARIAHRMHFKDFARWTLDRGGFYSNDRVAHFLNHVLPCKDFSELKIPLAVVATELSSGEPAVFRSGSIADPVRASCAYPGVFTPVSVNGVLHVDGMLSYEVPTTPLKQMGIDCVLGVLLRTYPNLTAAPRHFLDVIVQCFAIAQARMSLQWIKDADLLLQPDVQDFSFDQFERADEMIAVGEQCMRAELPALKEALGITPPAPQPELEAAPPVAAPVEAKSSEAAAPRPAPNTANLHTPA
jgi:NTE family protein